MEKIEIPQPNEWTNRELGILMSSIAGSLNQLIIENKQDHENVMAKQDHTNGDVTALKLWKSKVTGAFLVVSTIIGFVVYQTPLVQRVIQIIFS